MHAILHLPEDAKRFGPLTRVSSFPFESFNASFKRFIRARKHPVQEYMNRYYEKCNISFFCDPLERKQVHTFIVGEYLVVPINVNDLLNPELRNINCKIYNNTSSVFDDPLNSKILSIFKCKSNDFVVRSIQKHLLKVRCIIFQRNEEHLVIPLWHTLQ